MTVFKNIVSSSDERLEDCLSRYQILDAIPKR
jgi:hypothetical protein